MSSVETPHAVVIGLGTNGLAVVRGLARQGVPTTILLSEADKKTPYYHTRYGKKLILPNLEGPTVMDCLNALPDKAVLFPTLEHIVAWLSDHRYDISGGHVLLFPDPDVVAMMLDKEKFDRFARQHSLILPGSWVVRENSDLGAIKQQCRYPLIIKPLHKLYCSGLQKAYLVETEDKLDSIVAKYLKSTKQCIVQEFIPGEDKQIYFCMQYIGKDGVLKASFAGRKIRQWRPLSGGTASCEPVDIPELHGMTKSIFQKAGFWGVGSMEYKRDARDGKFYCIEPTVCRTDFQEYIAISNGVNIPFIAYCDAIGKPVATVIKNGGSKAWMHFTNDRLAAEDAFRKEELTRRQWMYSLRYVRCFDCFSLRDPGPMLSYGKTIINNRILR